MSDASGRTETLAESAARLLPVALLVLGALLAVLMGTRDVGLGAVAPVRFTVPDLHDSGRQLRSADFDDAPMLLNVWATWCVPCRQEHAQLLRLAQSGEVAIVGIAWRDRREDALRWLAHLGNPYMRVGDDSEGRTATALGVRAVPETLLIAADGRILHRHVGPLDEEVWRDVLRPLLRRETGPPAAHRSIEAVAATADAGRG